MSTKMPAHGARLVPCVATTMPMTQTRSALQDNVLEQLQALLFGLRARFHASLREDAERADDSPGALAPMEARLLQQLARHPDWTQADLVTHSRRDKAQVTRLIQQLEARGLLRREAHAQDRRKWQLYLTDAGQALQQGLQARRKRLAARLVNRFEPAELQQLGALLARMRANLDEPDTAP